MSRKVLPLALAVTGTLALAACGGGSDPLSTSSSSSSGGSSSSGSGQVVVGSADFSESALLAEIYAGALKGAGVDASAKTNIGAREIYLKALQDGSVQVVPEYTGALAMFYKKDFAETNPEKVYDGAKAAVPSDLELLDKSAAEDNDSITVTKETADKDSLKTISDIKAKAGDLTLGAPPEFKTRPQGVPGLEKTYGITFGQFRPLRGQALVQALKNGQVDAANLFSTDPAIAANDFVVLQDDKKLFGSQNVVPLIKKGAVDDKGVAALNAVSKALTTEKLSQMLQQTDVEKKDPAQVATQFLTDNKLG